MSVGSGGPGDSLGPGGSGGGPIGTVGNPEDELQTWTRQLVRGGFVTGDALLTEVVGAIESELPGIDASILARAWIGGAQAELRRAAATWPTPSDHDQLTAAFAECTEHDLHVQQGVDAPTPVDGARGVVWFDQPAVWRALTTGVLDLNVVDPAGSPVADGDWLVNAVLTCLQRHGLRARWSDGVQVATRWQRRP